MFSHFLSFSKFLKELKITLLEQFVPKLGLSRICLRPVLVFVPNLYSFRLRIDPVPLASAVVVLDKKHPRTNRAFENSSRAPA